MTPTENTCAVPQPAIDKQALGLFGVHYLAAELARKGYVPVMTSRNAKGIDLLVSNEEGSKAITLQVKTHRGKDFPIVSFSDDPTDSKEGFRKLKEKISPSPTKYFALVEVSDDGKDEFRNWYFIPSRVMLNFVKENIKDYLGLDSHGRITKRTRKGNLRKWTGSFSIWENRLEAYEGKLQELTSRIT